MFLGILAVIALAAGTVQTASELNYIDAVNLGSSEEAVVQVIEPVDIQAPSLKLLDL